MRRGWHFLLILLVTVAATGRSAPAAGELRISVNVTTIESFPVFLAAESMPGVLLEPAPNGRIAMSQLVSGAVDAATGSETQVLLNATAEPRLRIVMTLAECKYRIVARRSAGIRRVSDLRGKKVAATLNTSSQYLLSGMLQKARLKDADVQVVPLEGQEMAAALKSGAVDAVAIWEPHAQNSLEALGSDFVVFEDPAVYTERFNLNTRSDVLADPARRAALARFVREIQTASTRLRNRPSDFQRALAPRVGLSERTVLAVWPQFRFPASLQPELRTSMNEVEVWAAALQNRKAHSDTELAALIDASVLAEAADLKLPNIPR
jgi:NitT/TauT family transport system substrate-binding protein